VRWSEKKRLGQLAYVLAGLRALREQLPRLELQLPDGRSDSGELILIGNGRFYGGRWPLFPKAEMADGRMDVLVVPQVRVLGAARILWALQFDHLDERAGVRHYQVESCSIRADCACEFELEGDNVGMVPLNISMRPGALRVVVPG
jgi:diacylglycerol kinase family enzyme